MNSPVMIVDLVRLDLLDDANEGGEVQQVAVAQRDAIGDPELTQPMIGDLAVRRSPDHTDTSYPFAISSSDR